MNLRHLQPKVLEKKLNFCSPFKNENVSFPKLYDYKKSQEVPTGLREPQHYGFYLGMEKQLA